MLLYIIFINLLLFFTTWGKNVHLISKESPSTAIKPDKEISVLKDLKLVSEGGTVNVNTSLFEMPNENHTILMSVDEEFDIKKQKPVMPRKGAQFNESEEVNISSSATKPIVEQVQSTPQGTNVSNNSLSNTYNSSKLSSNIKLNITSNLNSPIDLDMKMAVTEHLKKPTLLSYDILANMDIGKKYDDVKLNKQLHAPKSSVDPVMPDQIPPTSNKKAHLVPSSRYPEMVTPIVITILVVPVFAVLGYMALKRGKEAWKNRHYKRVDFLLDGMYND